MSARMSCPAYPLRLCSGNTSSPNTLCHFPVFLVEFGLLEHDVGNGTVIRHHAVYKADESPLILQ